MEKYVLENDYLIFAPRSLKRCNMRGRAVGCVAFQATQWCLSSLVVTWHLLLCSLAWGCFDKVLSHALGGQLGCQCASRHRAFFPRPPCPLTPTAATTRTMGFRGKECARALPLTLGWASIPPPVVPTVAPQVWFLFLPRLAPPCGSGGRSGPPPVSRFLRRAARATFSLQPGGRIARRRIDYWWACRGASLSAIAPRPVGPCASGAARTASHGPRWGTGDGAARRERGALQGPRVEPRRHWEEASDHEVPQMPGGPIAGPRGHEGLLRGIRKGQRGDATGHEHCESVAEAAVDAQAT